MDYYDDNRVREVAFAITFAFERADYHYYEAYVYGGIRYGRMGAFRLNDGTLEELIMRYLGVHDTPILRQYLPNLRNRQAKLRSNGRFREYLINLGESDQKMQYTQEVALREMYWEPIQENYVRSRNFVTPLARAMVFDAIFQHGYDTDLFRQTDAKLGIPHGQPPLPHGIEEKVWLRNFARLRHEELIRKVNYSSNLRNDGMSKFRGRFWAELIHKDNWLILPDPDGMLAINHLNTERVFINL